MKEKIKRGINYGNALECYDSNVRLSCKELCNHVDDNGIKHPLSYEFSVYSGNINELEPTETFIVNSIEELWKNPETTKEIIQYYADIGFTAMRLPINLWYHRNIITNDTSVNWLEYVRSVVNMIIDAGMFCLVDVHCENCVATLKDVYEEYTDLDSSTSFNQLLKRWVGLANTLKDIPEDKMAFELLNEFNLGRGYNTNQEYKNDCKILSNIYSKLIAAIRETGGHNVERLIGIDGYRADNGITASQIEQFQSLLDDDKIFLCMMCYLMPEFTFCYNESFGKKTFLEDDENNESDINRVNSDMYGLIKLSNKGYRIVVVEYGTQAYDNFAGTEEETELYHKGCVKMTLLESLWCEKLGIPTFAWDCGNVVDRFNLTVKIPDLLKAIFRDADQDIVDYLYSIMKI